MISNLSRTENQIRESLYRLFRVDRDGNELDAEGQRMQYEFLVHVLAKYCDPNLDNFDREIQEAEKELGVTFTLPQRQHIRKSVKIQMAREAVRA